MYNFKHIFYLAITLSAYSALQGLNENRFPIPMKCEHGDHISALAISSDELFFVSGGWDGRAIIWDMTGKINFVLDPLCSLGNVHFLTDVKITHNNKFVITASSDRKVRVWNVETGTLIKVLEGHLDFVKSIEISQDDSFIASVSNDSVIIWDLLSGEIKDKIDSFSNISSQIKTESIDPFTRLIYREIRNKSTLFSNNFKLVKFSNKNEYILFTEKNTAYIYYINRKEKIKYKLQKHKNKISTISISEDNLSIVTTDDFGNCIIWNASNGVKKIELLTRENTKPVVSTYIMNDNKELLITYWDGNSYCYNIETGDLLETFLNSGWILNTALSLDNTYFILGSENKAVSIRNLKTKKNIIKVINHQAFITCTSISKNNNYLVTASHDKNILIYKLAHLEEIC